MNWGTRNRMIRYAGYVNVVGYKLLAVLESQETKLGFSTLGTMESTKMDVCAGA